MKYKTIIFDFFEVIHRDPLELLLIEKGHTRRSGPFAEICAQLDLGQIDYETYMKRLAVLLEEKLGDFKQKFEALNTVHPGMPELIRCLRSNHQIGLLSNSTSEEINPLLDRHSLRDLFDHIIISAEVGIKKPDAGIYHMMLEQLETKPEETIFIDDNPRNLAAASKIGITGICFGGVDLLRLELIHLGIRAGLQGQETSVADAS